MIKLQAFNGVVALTALLLSSVVTEQRNTRRSVQLACQELAEVLNHLAAGEARPALLGRGTPRPADIDADIDLDTDADADACGGDEEGLRGTRTPGGESL
ncbi:hypothetical protein NKH77_16770 [Streptomyces sp. M19]